MFCIFLFCYFFTSHLPFSSQVSKGSSFQTKKEAKFNLLKGSPLKIYFLNLISRKWMWHFLCNCLIAQNITGSILRGDEPEIRKWGLECNWKLEFTLFNFFSFQWIKAVIAVVYVCKMFTVSNAQSTHHTPEVKVWCPGALSYHFLTEHQIKAVQTPLWSGAQWKWQYGLALLIQTFNTNCSTRRLNPYTVM